MTVVALVAVPLAHRLPLAADIAQELYTRRVTTRYQTQRSTQTTACERGDTDATCQLVGASGTAVLTLSDR